MDPVNKKGFTLVEVLTAVTVIVVGTVFINQAFIRCLDATRRSEEAMTVAFLLEKAAVNLRIQTWEGLPPGGDVSAAHASGLPDGPYDFMMDRQAVGLGMGMFSYFEFQILREGKKLGSAGFLANQKMDSEKP